MPLLSFKNQEELSAEIQFVYNAFTVHDQPCSSVLEKDLTIADTTDSSEQRTREGSDMTESVYYA